MKLPVFKMTRRLSIASAAVLLVLVAAGCEGSAPSRAAVETPRPIPQLVRQSDGSEALQMNAGQVPGMTVVAVREVVLPGILETTGQVSFDDRRVATIVSRVAGRIEETRVSQWDNVRRGEPIVELYSPDFMTAEAEYLQAQTTVRSKLVRPCLASAGGLGGGAAVGGAAQAGTTRNE